MTRYVPKITKDEEDRLRALVAYDDGCPCKHHPCIHDGSEPVAALLAELDELRPEAKALGNLLAVVHGDGGQYQEQVGSEQAVRDAHERWAELMLRAADVEEQLQDVSTVLARVDRALQEMVTASQAVLQCSTGHAVAAPGSDAERSFDGMLVEAKERLGIALMAALQELPDERTKQRRSWPTADEARRAAAWFRKEIGGWITADQMAMGLFARIPDLLDGMGVAVERELRNRNAALDRCGKYIIERNEARAQLAEERLDHSVTDQMLCREKEENDRLRSAAEGRALPDDVAADLDVARANAAAAEMAADVAEEAGEREEALVVLVTDIVKASEGMIDLDGDDLIINKEAGFRLSEILGRVREDGPFRAGVHVLASTVLAAVNATCDHLKQERLGTMTIDRYIAPKVEGLAKARRRFEKTP